MADTMKVKCPICGTPVNMPEDWDGKDPDEALCNHCNVHIEGDVEAIEAFGCKYLGNDFWDCGWIDNRKED